MPIRHLKVLTTPPDPDPALADVDDWNDPHVIDDGSIGIAKLEDVASGVFVGRATALAGPVELMSAATSKALLAIQIGDVAGLTAALTALSDAITGIATGLADIATSGSAADLVAGVVPEARLPEEFTMATSAAAAPTAGQLKIFATSIGGRMALGMRGPDGEVWMNFAPDA